MKVRSWILFVICVAVFISLRLMAAKHKPQEENAKIKPSVPEPVLVHKLLLDHPWVAAQPAVSEINSEIMRDLAALDAFCKKVQDNRKDVTREQIETLLITRLTALQKKIPFELPDTFYNVLFIPEIPQEWVKAPLPFQVYKRLYLGEIESGLPFYLDVRVFELNNFPVDELIAWHLDTLDGEPLQLQDGAYFSTGYRTRETAHGFAKGKRGLFVAFKQQGDQLFVLYAEAPIKDFRKQELLFNLLVTYD